MAQLVSKSELARLAGVTKAAITKAAVKQFPKALIGPRVDLDHSDVQRYLAQRRGGQTAASVSAPEPQEAPVETDQGPPVSPAVEESAIDEAHRDVRIEDIERYAHLSLDALTKKFGTAVAFGDWLDARKRISDIREKDLKNDERSGRLITREFVRTHVLSHIESSNRRLLQDGAVTITRRLFAAIKGGATVEDAQQLVRDIISSQLRPARDSAVRALKPTSDARH